MKWPPTSGAWPRPDARRNRICILDRLRLSLQVDRRAVLLTMKCRRRKDSPIHPRYRSRTFLFALPRPKESKQTRVNIKFVLLFHIQSNNETLKIKTRVISAEFELRSICISVTLFGCEFSREVFVIVHVLLLVSFLFLCSRGLGIRRFDDFS